MVDGRKSGLVADDRVVMAGRLAWSPMTGLAILSCASVAAVTSHLAEEPDTMVDRSEARAAAAVAVASR
jgi:hypothetical protein